MDEDWLAALWNGLQCERVTAGIIAVGTALCVVVAVMAK